jgi:hypothetical protein
MGAERERERECVVCGDEMKWGGYIIVAREMKTTMLC